MANGQTLLDELSDPSHPLRQREWNTFLERRQQLLDDIIQKVGLGVSTGGMDFNVEPSQAIDALAIQEAWERSQMDDDEILVGDTPEMRQRDYQQRFLGPAQLYGIEDAEDIPLGELEQILEERRRQRREGETDEDVRQYFRENLHTHKGPFTLGSADALLRTAETLPFLGQWASDQEAVQAMNRWIGQAREAHTGAMSERERQGAVIQETLGGLVGYIVPGIGAWKLAGWAMGAARIGGISKASQTIRGREIIQRSAETWGLRARNPILHRSIQGGLAATLLESGGDGPIEEKALNIGLGIGLGTAFEVGGPLAAGTFGGVAGGIVGASVDEPVVGAVTGVAMGLGLHRGYRAFSRQSGLNRGKHSGWHEQEPIWTRGFDVFDQALPSGNPRRCPEIVIPEGRFLRPAPEPPTALPPAQTPGGLPPGPQIAPRSRQLPEVSDVSRSIENHTYRGTRTLFYAGREHPEELLQQWGTLEQRGSLPADEPFTNAIHLDNTGRMIPGARRVFEVEADFTNMFVVTPESAPVLRQIAGDAQSVSEIQARLQNHGFDGLAVQGIDDAINVAGIDVVHQQTGLPTQLLQDQVIAFGGPHQVKLSRPIIDADLLDQAFADFGAVGGRQVAGVQATHFAREARKQLRPFVVGEAKATAPSPPEWLSEQRGVRFLRDSNAERHPLVPDDIDSAVLQHHPEFGPRVVLLDSDRVSKATIPVESLDQGTETLARLGFQHMDPNFQEEAVRLAHTMSNAERLVNNSYADIVGQVTDPTPMDLIAIGFAENPGRLSVVSDIGNPFELRANLDAVNRRYNQIVDFDNNLMIVERPAGVFHAIAGPPEMLTPKVRKQFKEFGVFSGMEATGAHGSPIRVNSVWREKSGRERASISPLYSDIKATVPLDYVVPGRTSVQQPLTGDVYSKFKKFALGDFNREAKQAGLDPATELADPRVLSFVDRYIDEYMARQGVTDPNSLNRFADALEWNLATDVKRLAGEDGTFFEQMLKEQANEMSKATVQGNFIVPDVEELALTKGFIWEPPWRGKPGQLVDQKTNEIIPFVEKSSAKAFLQNFHREASDHTPKEMIYSNAFQGFDSHAIKPTNTGVEFPNVAAEVRSHKGTLQKAMQEADELTDQMDQAAAVLEAIKQHRAQPRTPPSIEPPAGGTPPPEPPTPPTRLPPPGDEPPIPGSSVTPDPMETRIALRELERHRPRGRHEYQDAQFLHDLGEVFGGRPSLNKDLQGIMDRPLVKMFAPVRTAAQILDQELTNLGITRPTVFRNLDDVLQGKTIATNESVPWMREGWDIVKRFDRGDRRRGQLYEVMTASTEPNQTLMNQYGWPDERSLLMDQFGFSPDQRQAVDELRDFFNRLHTEAAGFADVGFVFDYLPRLRYFLDLDSARGYHNWEQALPENLKWFATYAREGRLETYHKDVGRVMETYIRGMMFEKHVRAPYERARALATDDRVPPALRDFVGNVLHVARKGHPKGHDAALRSMTAGFNHISDVASSIFGTPKLHVTESEVMSAFGMLATTQYRGLLGNSPRTILREFYQPMLAAPEIGIRRVLSTYSTYLKDRAARQEMSERAIRYGWSEPSRVAVANSEFFTGELKNVLGRTAFAPEVAAARETVASMWDSVYDGLPNSAKLGIEGNPFIDPLWAYRKFSTNPGREIAGNAGYLHAMDAIQRWQRGEISFDQMMRQSNAGQKPYSVREEFRELVSSGDYEGAAARMGTEAAGTQFYFGIAEQSEMIRNAGIVGRLAMQFGNFSNQFAWRTAREMKHRDWRGRISYGAKIAALATVPGTIGAKIGWEEMNRYNWFLSTQFGGGIFVDPVVNLMHANTGLRKTISGGDLTPEERFAMSRFMDVWQSIPLNPYGSTVRTIRGYLNALQDENPAEAMFRMTITGMDESAAADRFFDSMGEDIQREIQPQPGTPIPGNLERLGITPEEWESFVQNLDSIAASGGGSRN